MNNASEFIDATPSAALLIESIRDIGYTIETAISEIKNGSVTYLASIFSRDRKIAFSNLLGLLKYLL